MTTDTFFFSLFLLFDSHTHKNKKKTIKIKQGDLSFSCLLVLYFSIPRCLLGFFFVFFQFSVGAPIHFCVCVCQKSYSFFFFWFRFFLFFQYENKRATHFLIDSGDGKAAGTNARRCVMCLFVLLLFFLIAPSHLHKDTHRGK